MNIVKVLSETEQFCHYLTSAGTIISIEKTSKSLTRPQSMSKAIQMARGV